MKKSNGKKSDSKPEPAVSETPAKVPPLFRKIDWLALFVAFIGVWLVYFCTLAPEQTLEDSGELCTGSFYAGIPHPPGYPFWSNDPVSHLIDELKSFKSTAGQRAQMEEQVQSMEDKARANPTDWQNIFSLAGYYLQTRRTNRANELLEQAISRPNVPPGVLRGVAQFFAQTGQLFRVARLSFKNSSPNNGRRFMTAFDPAPAIPLAAAKSA